MKNYFDPHLIKFGIIALIFIGRSIAAANRKRQTQNRSIAPPQGGPLSSSLNSPPTSAPLSSPPVSSSQAPPPAPSMSSRPPRKSNVPDSPWSDLK